MKSLQLVPSRPLALVLGLLLATASPALAQAGKGFEGMGDPNGTNTESPGEDIGTVPASYDDPSDDLGPDAPGGIVLVGRPKAIAAVVTRIRGRGVVTIEPSGSSREVVLTFEGDMHVTFDQAALLASEVHVLFRTGDYDAVWTAQAIYGDWTSLPFELGSSQSLEVPMHLVGGNRPPRLALFVADSLGGSLRMKLVAHDDLVTVSLRNR